MTSQVKTWLAALASSVAIAGTAMAVPLNVTITNNSQTDGLNLTPLFVAFHNGSVDFFDVGGSISPGAQFIAEEGGPGLAIAEAQAADANAIATAIGAPGGFPGAPVIEAGETATLVFDVDPTTQRYFSYLSMVIPSNDTFIGNDNALVLFDAAGNYLGDRTIEITGERIWDAGTEVNDLTDGPAFVVGATGPNTGTDENNPVSLSDGIGFVPTGLQLPNGSILNALLADFVTDRAGFSLATISISAVQPVPLPGALPLMAAALGMGGIIRHRKKKSTA